MLRPPFPPCSPVRDTVVTNDRWGLNSICKHGGYYTCADRYMPGHLLARKWENCMSIDRKSWGYRREAPLADYLTIEQLITVRVLCGNVVVVVSGSRNDSERGKCSTRG